MSQKAVVDALEQHIYSAFSATKLTKAEKVAISNAALGQSKNCWSFQVKPRIPEQTNPALWVNPQMVVRAELVRFLCTDREAHKKIHQRGLHVRYAVINKTERPKDEEATRDDLDLDLDSTDIPFSIYFLGCEFPGGVQIRDSRTRLVGFQRCNLGEVRIDRTSVAGSLWLTNCRIDRPVSIRSTNIDQSLRLEGSIIEYAREHQFTSVKSENLKSGERSQFAVDLSQTKIGGTLDVSVARVTGRLSFHHASTAIFRDGLTSYKLNSANSGNPISPELNGFTYDDIESDLDMHWRKEHWLYRARENAQRQPFEQLAQFYRFNGQQSDSLEIQTDKERTLWNARISDEQSWWSRLVLSTLYKTYDLTTHMGHRPLYMVRAIFFIWLLGTLLYFSVAELGLIAPRDKQLVLQESLEPCRCDWTACTNPEMQYRPQFNPVYYSIDLMLPILDLEQKKVWEVTAKTGCRKPIRTQETILASVASGYGVFQRVFGWIAGIILIAVSTRRMVRNE